MKYTIVFTARAIETSNAIKQQLQNRWGQRTVADFENRVLKIMRLIEESPFMFPEASFDENLRKGFIHKNCSVFYEIRAEHVVVHFFWDNRQDPL